MTPARLALLIAAVILLAGLTIYLLTAAGVPPLAILVIALVFSVLVRLWARRR